MYLNIKSKGDRLSTEPIIRSDIRHFSVICFHDIVEKNKLISHMHSFGSDAARNLNL